MNWDEGCSDPGFDSLAVPVVVDVQFLSRVRLLATPWTAAYQALPSMGFSRQEYRKRDTRRAL